MLQGRRSGGSVPGVDEVLSGAAEALPLLDVLVSLRSIAQPVLIDPAESGCGRCAAIGGEGRAAGPFPPGAAVAEQSPRQAGGVVVIEYEGMSAWAGGATTSLEPPRQRLLFTGARTGPGP